MGQEAEIARQKDKGFEQALRQSESFIDHIFRSMVDVLIVIGPHGTVVNVNEATCSLLGYRGDELIGKPAKLVFSEECLDRMDASQLSLSEKERSSCNTSPADHFSDVESWLIAKNGGKIPVCVSGSRMMNRQDGIQGLVCIACDISERKKMEESLKLQGAVLESSVNAIVISDRDERISWINRVFCKLTGYCLLLGSKNPLLQAITSVELGYGSVLRYWAKRA
ncbi:MAG: PAS domain S-box protein [Pirellulales bacterium]